MPKHTDANFSNVLKLRNPRHAATSTRSRIHVYSPRQNSNLHPRLLTETPRHSNTSTKTHNQDPLGDETTPRSYRPLIAASATFQPGRIHHCPAFASESPDDLIYTGVDIYFSRDTKTRSYDTLSRASFAPVLNHKRSKCRPLNIHACQDT